MSEPDFPRSPTSGNVRQRSDYGKQPIGPPQSVERPLPMVETAFLASATAIIWLIQTYVPIPVLGTFLRIFFPIPTALIYLRWGRRSAWISACVTTLLISILMGPPRSIQFLMPFGLVGVILGGFWKRQVSWAISMGWSIIVMAIGFFFQLSLLSLLVGVDLWLYVNRQITGFLDWIAIKIGLLVQPEVIVVQLFAIGLILLNALLYILLVHLVAWLVFDRMGVSIPDPPLWLQTFLEYQDE
ncbi:DUF2232 domain-containing protein [Acaryochloris sp. IP29b_bin.137]|uniref:DUF2232 domain-containing protein n=1 Tax=Acaryochloris sp. IP29b_bin.137 TaxID=2969217 RepID=UPI00260CFBD0|nr:DUF2232 domain-containing protein [Acaryochloris sp. IP29b_bin.137]